MKPLLTCLAALCLASGWIRAAPTNPAMRPEVSVRACPLETLEATTPDGHTAFAVVRKPPGSGPFPAILFLHGGLIPHTLAQLKQETQQQPTQARFLAAGYMTVAATFRSRQEDPQTRDALADCLALLERVKKIPEVDPNSVVVFGGSGGGSLAVEMAGEVRLCAIAVGEPATMLFTGTFTREIVKDRKHKEPPLYQNPMRFYTPVLQTFTRDKVGRIDCPILIMHGDKHPLNKYNEAIFIPELKRAGKTFETILYPGQPHGFYWGFTIPVEVGLKVFDDSHAFFIRYLPTQPVPLDPSIIKLVPVGRGKAD